MTLPRITKSTGSLRVRLRFACVLNTVRGEFPIPAESFS